MLWLDILSLKGFYMGMRIDFRKFTVNKSLHTVSSSPFLTPIFYKHISPKNRKWRKKINVFFYSKIAGKDLIMGVDNLNFEKQPATSPEYEKLLFLQKGCFTLQQSRITKIHWGWERAPRPICFCENCKAFLRGARQTVLRVTESLQSHHSPIQCFKHLLHWWHSGVTVQE